MPQVTFVNEKKTIEVPQGANLRKEAMKAGVQVYAGIHKVAHCPGLGMCHSCKVEVTKGVENIPKPGLWERITAYLGPRLLFFARLDKGDSIRLSCCTKITGDCEVKTHPDVNLYGEKFWG